MATLRKLSFRDPAALAIFGLGQNRKQVSDEQTNLGVDP